MLGGIIAASFWRHAEVQKFQADFASRAIPAVATVYDKSFYKPCDKITERRVCRNQGRLSIECKRCRRQVEDKIHYTYQDYDGITYQGAQTVSSQLVSRLEQGSSIDIYFDPGDPSISMTAEQIDRIRQTG